MSTGGSGNCEEPNKTNRNSARSTCPLRGNEVGRGHTKVPARLKTQTDTCVAHTNFELNSALEPPKQNPESQAVETRHVSITPSYCTDVERKVGLICHSPGWIPYSPIPVRTIQIRVRWQMILVKQLVIVQIKHCSFRERQGRPCSEATSTPST